MRYKTRKYIKKFFLYTINTILFLLLYTYAAHKNYLPAFFEYYTGEKARHLTQKYYNQYFADESEKKVSVLNIHDVLDFVVREPVYLYLQDTFNLMDRDRSDVSQKVKNDAMAIGTHPAIIEWLKELRGQFASVYQYEIIRYIDNMDSVYNYVILDSTGKVVFSKGKSLKNYDTMKQSTEFAYYDGMISVPVSHNKKIIGRVIANVKKTWNTELDFMNTGYDISYVILDDSQEVTKSQGYLNIQIRDQKYTGPKSGRHDGYRYLMKIFQDNMLIVAYPAESVLFYIFKLFVYVALAGLIIVFLLFWKSGGHIEIQEKYFQRSKGINVDDLLLKSSQINQEYAAITVKFQNSMQVMKGQEIDRLRVISEHLTYLHQTMNLTIQDGGGEIKNIDKV